MSSSEPRDARPHPVLVKNRRQLPRHRRHPVRDATDNHRVVIVDGGDHRNVPPKVTRRLMLVAATVGGSGRLKPAGPVRPGERAGR
ncbi:MAG TPA: hypothetical protein VIV12_00970, partial [Streptosporangiaceae bacterium]